METVRLFRKYEPTISPHSRLRRLVKTSRLRLTGVLQTLETSGTVRDARGLASRTNTLPSSIAYCMFMRPQNHTRREQRKCLHFHCRAVWVSENVEGFGNLASVILDGRKIFLGDGHRRDNAGGVTGVDTGKFHVFHHGRDVNVFAVGEGVGFAFESVVEEAVDEERTVRCHAHGLRHVFAEHVFVVNHFHAAATEHKTRTNHDGVTANLLHHREGFVNVCSHARFRHRDFQLVHHLAEQIAVFGDVDRVNARTENLDAFVAQSAGDVNIPARKNR